MSTLGSKLPGWAKAGLSLAVLAFCLGADSCGAPSPPLNLIVFLEATPDPRLNSSILNDFLFPLHKRLANSQRAINVEIYAISANTEAETALLRLSLDEGWRTEDDVNALVEDFQTLQQRFDRVYPAGSSYLIDVLGSATLLDRFLGSSSGGPVEALYLSDMIQQEEFDDLDPDADRYDFTEMQRAKSLEDCKRELESRLAKNLLHRNLFRNVRVHLVQLGLDTMTREGETQMAIDGVVVETHGVVTATNMDEIQTFWKRDFFQNFLHTGEVHSYPGVIDRALDAMKL